MINFSVFQEEIIKSLNCKIKDKKLRVSLERYFCSKRFINNKLPTSFKQYKLCVYNFIDVMHNVKYKNLGWEFLCNTIYKYSLRKLEYSLSHVRFLVESYFLYLLEYEYMNTELLSLLKRKEYLIKEGFYAKINECSLSEPFNIHTQYPIDTKMEYIYQYSFKGDLNDGAVNINFNTDNEFLYRMLSSFIEQFDCEVPKRPLLLPYKIFYYYFEESFSPESIPNSETDFNEKSFKRQYYFYKQKEEKLFVNSKPSISLCRVLINFYVFMLYHLDSLEIKHNIFEVSNYNAHLLLNSNFSYNYENGYVNTIYNPLEDYPDYDRWWLDTGLQASLSVSMVNMGYLTLDFTKVNQITYKNDLKAWLWFNSGLIRHKAKRIYAIIDFLNFKDEYDNGKVIQLKKNYKIPFSFDMIWFYLVNLDEKHDNLHTKRDIANYVRNFLKFYKEKYNIDQKALDLLKLEYGEGEGTPINKKDVELILNEFKSQKDTYKDGQLLYFIFILCITTNLRIGEILNLERNCIIYQDDKGNGTIRLRRKISKGEYFEREYNAETIQIIKLCINLTDKYVPIASDKFKNYIFITSSIKNKKDVIRLSGKFNSQFYNIIRKLENEIDKLYRPYNLRHTFINAIYDDGIINNVSIDKLQSITDNNYHTVMKHYRKKLELIDYVEIMSKVIISNVDIEGNILVDDELIVNNHPVMNNLGGCSEEDCTNEKTTLCLICSHFFTCLSKIPVFEERVLYYREKLNNVKANDSIKTEYETYLSLYATYLTKMLEMKNDLRR